MGVRVAGHNWEKSWGSVTAMTDAVRNRLCPDGVSFLGTFRTFPRRPRSDTEKQASPLRQMDDTVERRRGQTLGSCFEGALAAGSVGDSSLSVRPSSAGWGTPEFGCFVRSVAQTSRNLGGRGCEASIP